MCSSASVILASIVKICVSCKCQFQGNDIPQALKYIKIASKLTNVVRIFMNIALAGEHIFLSIGSILVSITTILASIEQVNTP